MRSFKPCFFFHCKATQFPTVFLHYGCLLWLTAIEWPCCRGRSNLGNAEQKCITGLLRNPISFFYLKISLCLEVVRFAFIWLLYCSECHIALKFDSRHGRTVAQMLVSTFKAIWQFEHVTVSSFTRLRDKTSYRIPWRRRHCNCFYPIWQTRVTLQQSRLHEQVCMVCTSALFGLRVVKQIEHNISKAWNVMPTSRNEPSKYGSDEHHSISDMKNWVVFIRAIFRWFIFRNWLHVLFDSLGKLRWCPMCWTTRTPNITHIHAVLTR